MMENISRMEKMKSNSIEAKLDGINPDTLSKENKTAYERIVSKLGLISRRLLRTVGCLAVAGTTFATINYHNTRYNTKKTYNENNEVVYFHEDERTTHYLNIIAGRDSFNIDDYTYIARVGFTYLAKFDKLDIEEDMMSMSLEELDAVAAKYWPDDYEPGKLIKEVKEGQDLINTTDTILDNPDIYNLIWKLENECGNPKIRFLIEDMNFTPVAGYKGALHYSPFENTIFIEPLDLIKPMKNEGFISEISHAKQFSDKPAQSYLKFIRDGIRAIKVGGMNIDEIAAEYKRMYLESGRFENDAHHKIEPYLREKYRLQEMPNQE